MAAYFFPVDIVGNPQYQHCMVIKTYKSDASHDNSNPNSYTNKIDDFYMFIPGGGQSSMSWQHQHEYTDVKLARVAASFLGVEELAGAADTVMGILGGKRINPRIDVLYRTTNLREYDFMFLMAPTSLSESNMMKNIVNRLRWAAAPSATNDVFNLDFGNLNLFSGAQSAVFDFPSEVIIEFHYKNSDGTLVPNPHIPKISPGVIKQINVDYTPQGEWSTFGNGHPVSCMLQFRFMETRIIDKTMINRGY